MLSPFNSRPRPEFPLFTGKDVHGWLYRVEHLLDYYNAAADQQVRMAALHLDEKPLRWYRWLVRMRPLVWEEFVRDLVSMYDTAAVVDFAGELSKLKPEGSTFDEYQAEFMRLSHHVQGLSEEFLVSCFVSGLKDLVKYELMSKNPKTIIEAMRLARIEEDKMATKRYSKEGPSLDQL